MKGGLAYLARMYSVHHAAFDKAALQERLRINKCNLLSYWIHLLFPVGFNYVNFYQSKCLNQWMIEQVWWVHIVAEIPETHLYALQY